MKRIIPFLFLLVGACGVTERVEIIREAVGCTSDEMCDDHDVDTTDWCEADSGFCNHERTVRLACETFTDCDDGDMTSVDTCVEGVCSHTRDTERYDPREYQDFRSYCEMPVAYCDPGDALGAREYLTASCYGERNLWDERGYAIILHFRGIDEDGTRVTIRPALRAGDPDDTFRFSIEMDSSGNGWPDSPAIVTDMTAHDVERDGLTVTFRRPTSPETPTDATSNMFRIRVEFADPTTYTSRAMQWAVLPGGIVDADTGMDYMPCPVFGPYTDVPHHGLLHLTEEVGTGVPQCEGIVRGTETWWDDPTHPASGLFRTESDPTLRYASDFISTPHRLIEFRSMREFADWFGLDHPSWNHRKLCAGIGVFPDSSLTASREVAEAEQVGVRPGRPVSWTDPTTLVRHYGISDRRWTIHDVGTDSGVIYNIYDGLACTSYQLITGEYAAYGSSDCILNLDWLALDYEIIPGDPSTLDPERIGVESGGLYWYNHDPPFGP